MRTFAVVSKETHEFFGSVSYTPNYKNNSAMVGYWIGEEHWGKGYASKALEVMIILLLKLDRFNSINATHCLQNPASGRVMQKNGMKYEGITRAAYKKDNQYYDAARYSIPGSEWLEIQQKVV